MQQKGLLVLIILSCATGTICGTTAQGKRLFDNGNLG